MSSSIAPVSRTLPNGCQSAPVVSKEVQEKQTREKLVQAAHKILKKTHENFAASLDGSDYGINSLPVTLYGKNGNPDIQTYSIWEKFYEVIYKNLNRFDKMNPQDQIKFSQGNLLKFKQLLPIPQKELVERLTHEKYGRLSDNDKKRYESIMKITCQFFLNLGKLGYSPEYRSALIYAVEAMKLHEGATTPAQSFLISSIILSELPTLGV